MKSCVAPLLAAALVLSGCSRASHDLAAGGAAAIPVVTTTVSAQPVPLTITTVGTLLASDSAAVRARVDGQLQRVAFREGEEVRANQVLFELDARPYQAQLALAEANLAKSQATLARARAQLQRYDELLAKSYVAADDYAQVRANEQTAAAAVQADRAAVQSARLNLEYCTLRAPLAGRTGAVALRAGNLVKAGDGTVLVTVTRMDQLYADFAVPQQYLEALRQAVRAGVAVVTIATGDAAEGSAADQYGHASHVDFIDNRIDQDSGTVRVRATIANLKRSLWPQQFIHVRLQLEPKTPVLAIPLAALGTGPEGSYVFVIDAQQHARQRPVTVLRQTDQLAVISHGLSAGERIVSDGQSRLQDGALVRLVAPAH